eukprot:SAG22_NODE_19375_length_275_cov_1.142045_1_plen_65_part_01
MVARSNSMKEADIEGKGGVGRAHAVRPTRILKKRATQTAAARARRIHYSIEFEFHLYSYNNMHRS